MVALHLDLLAGRYAATAATDRRRGEWPPHPARVFAALVDALHADATVDPAQAAALDALAAAEPPWIIAAPAHPRRVMTHYVPINDQAVTDAAHLSSAAAALADAQAALAQLDEGDGGRARGKAERAVAKARARLEAAGAAAAAPSAVPKQPTTSLPQDRLRKERTFPAMIPAHPRITFAWPELMLPAAAAQALGRLAAAVARVGHSSSFAHLTVTTEALDLAAQVAHGARELWRPAEPGALSLRVPAPGQREALEAAFAQHRGDTPGRVLPARAVPYARHQPGPVGHTLRSDGVFIAYHLAAASLPPAHAALAFTQAVRGALLHHAPDPLPPLLSGHTPDGAPLDRPHLAVWALPFVGHPHADGALRGFAVSLPADAEPAVREALFTALGRWEAAGDPVAREVPLHVAGRTYPLVRVLDPLDTLHTLRAARWAGPAAVWHTALPLVLDGLPGPLVDAQGALVSRSWRKAARLVRRAVLRAVVPPAGRTLQADDIQVELSWAPASRGAPDARRLSFARPRDRLPRILLHAKITLPFPIRGPLALGAGRHFGLGLCQPIPGADAPEAP